ncbi:hypothetical protein ONZ45_g6275 [Pleurotus djamor]|nr:hypothetical protein ONZ45_g6275 [Pleurotus djamor]
MDPLWSQRAWRIFSAAMVRAFGHAYGHNNFHKDPRFKLIEYALSRSSIRSKLFGLFTDKIKFTKEVPLRALNRHYAAPGDPNYELYCPPTYALDIPRLLSSPSLRWALDMPGPLVTMNKDLLQVQASASLPMVAHGLGRRAMASFIPHPPFGPTEERVLKRKRGDGGGHAGQASPPATLDGSSQPPSRKRRREA